MARLIQFSKILCRLVVLTKLKFRCPSTQIIKFLLFVAIALSIINIFIQVAIYHFELKKEWFLLFNMDKEMNIPTLYSVLLLLCCAWLIKLIKKSEFIRLKSRKTIYKKWNFLQIIFVFLAIDEAFQIHEIFIIKDLKQFLPPLLSMVWVIPYGIFVLFLIYFFMPLIKSFPKKLKWLSVLAGGIYITGAIGIEVLGNYLVRTGDIKLHGITYGFIVTIEESMEIAGLILFIYALSSYLFSYLNRKIKINIRIS